MTWERVQLIGPLVGALAAPLAAWWVARRKSSGSIDHSEATELWNESAGIRADLTTRIAQLETRNNYLYERAERLQDRVTALEQANRDCVDRAAGLTDRVRLLEDERDRLRRDLGRGG